MGLIPRRKKKGKLPPTPPPPPPPPLDAQGDPMVHPPPPQNLPTEDFDSLVPIGGGRGTVTTPELGEYDQEWPKKNGDPAEQEKLQRICMHMYVGVYIYGDPAEQAELQRICMYMYVGI